jgi:hypothetical protein
VLKSLVAILGSWLGDAKGNKNGHSAHHTRSTGRSAARIRSGGHVVAAHERDKGEKVVFVIAIKGKWSRGFGTEKGSIVREFHTVDWNTHHVGTDIDARCDSQIDDGTIFQDPNPLVRVGIHEHQDNGKR